MANIKAFKALRYDPKIAGDPATLITPPYDVINQAMQDNFYQINPYNIIRLEWGKKYPTDNENENRYTRAAADFAAWQKNGVLKQDAKPSFYLYRQEFMIDGKSIVRSGFLTTILADGYASGQVLPHEETLPKHKADRLELMRHTFANFSPIFGLYAQPSQTIDKALEKGAANRQADIDIHDEYGVHHMLWVIDDPDTVALIEKEMKDLKVYIADGHHRYETASFFAKENAEKGIRGCEYMQIALVNLYDPGLIVLPTHRLVKNIPSLNKKDLLSKIAKAGFDVDLVCEHEKGETLAAMLAQMAQGGENTTSFGLYIDDEFYLLRLPDRAKAADGVSPGKSLAYRKLDVTLLHTLILEDILGIGPKELAEEGWIGYTRDDKEALDKVDSQEFQCCFFMNSTLVQELLDVAEAGEKMPQKSTFFYPKIIAGLVINKLGE